MLALNLLTLGFAAISAMAFPATKRTVSSCDGLGVGAFDTAYNFTLAAWNTTLPNSNTTGVPLVLGQAGATTGLSFKVFSTYASFPYNQYPNISLVAGRLIPEGPGATPAQDAEVFDGDEPTFACSNSVDPSNGAQVYCAVADVDPAGQGTGHPFLAVNGDTDSFSLCMVGIQNNVVYKPVAGKQYNINSCYPVKLQLIY